MQSEFDRNGFVVIRKFIEQNITELLQKYYHELVYFRLKNDRDFGRRHWVQGVESGDIASPQYILYGDFLTETILLLSKDKISNMLGKTLAPTYSFARIYERGDELIVHRDRPACEYSVSIPIFISDFKASTIFISNVEVNDSTAPGIISFEEVKNLGEYSQIDLMPGDALIYKGTKRYHWRKPLKSDLLIQFFMHYVQADGNFKNEVYDRRAFLGYPFPGKK